MHVRIVRARMNRTGARNVVTRIGAARFFLEYFAYGMAKLYFGVFCSAPNIDDVMVANVAYMLTTGVLPPAAASAFVAGIFPRLQTALVVKLDRATDARIGACICA